jgi:hypothetical protein
MFKVYMLALSTTNKDEDKMKTKYVKSEKKMGKQKTKKP